MAHNFAGYRTLRGQVFNCIKHRVMVTSRITFTALSWCCFQMDYTLHGKKQPLHLYPNIFHHLELSFYVIKTLLCSVLVLNIILLFKNKNALVYITKYNYKVMSK